MGVPNFQLSQGKIKWKKIHARKLILKIFMLWPKKNNENENEKKFPRLENPPHPPPPHNPHNVSNGPSLRNQRYGYFLRSAINEVWRHKYSTTLKLKIQGWKNFLGSVLELFTELDKLLRCSSSIKSFSLV